VQILTWNLMHGRAVPGAGRELLSEFGEALAGWAWDVALLQEVPPWWPVPLAERCGARQRSVLTSRNSLLPLRRAVASRWPDLIKSNGGGCNAILVRELRVLEHRAQRIGLWPERRWVHGVFLEDLWVANLHTEASPEQVVRAARAVLGWAGEIPLILGGDFNLRSPSTPGFGSAGGYGVDHVLVRGLSACAGAEVLEHGRLSDHAPVVVSCRGRPSAQTP
jgi:endonuclease/exonuclease/phosphatase family metal-dependent hydrolase